MKVFPPPSTAPPKELAATVCNASILGSVIAMGRLRPSRRGTCAARPLQVPPALRLVDRVRDVPLRRHGEPEVEVVLHLAHLAARPPRAERVEAPCGAGLPRPPRTA